MFDRDGLIKKIENFVLLAKKTVFGPYRRKNDGRQIIIIKHDDGSQETISYPKYILEQHLNRKLDKNTETVDHWDSNIDNNDISNLRIVPRDQHSADDTRRVKLIKLKCDNCNNSFERSPRLLRDKSKKGVNGTFCSRQCAGSYSRQVQLGKKKPAPPQPFMESEYYKRKYVNSIEILVGKFLQKCGVKIPE